MTFDPSRRDHRTEPHFPGAGDREIIFRPRQGDVEQTPLLFYRCVKVGATIAGWAMGVRFCGMDALRNLPGWHLLGAFPDNEPDDVGSWLVHNNGEALLLEIPPGLTVEDVVVGLESIGAGLRYVTASHLHEDHLDIGCWNELQEAFHGTHFMRPTEAKVGADILLNLGGEPLWLVKAPKHSPSDTVTVFRGVAMTGDIELGTLDSVNGEVSRAIRAASMDYLRGLEDRTGYYIHTIVSAHLNDFRQGVNWRGLFEVG